MSTEVLNSQENKELEYIAISDKKQSEESIQKNDLEKNFIPFTGKWRVKLFLLNNNGQWDDKGIGFIFLANEIQSQGNEGCSDISSPTHMVKKLIMLEENTKEFILNINITEEKHQIRLLSSDNDLFTDFLLKHIITIDNPATGIYDRELFTVPLALAILTITCRTGLIANNRLARFRQAVKQG